MPSDRGLGGEMRGVFGFVACVASALGLAACGPLDAQYYREGIGTDLYRPELREATQVQDLYIDYICRQADLAPSSPESCLLPQLSPQWMLFVQAGMNDIDLRCDAYLAWLDNKKRSVKPVLQQLSDTRSVTEAIMKIASASAESIVVTGLAFGFAASTFTNVNSRLVLEVDQTTVQTVVLTKQQNFRASLNTVGIANRPTAIHALRSYLRLCMPFTIETEINLTTTIAQRGGAAGIAAIERNPMITPGAVGPMRATTQLRPPIADPPLPGAATPEERAMKAVDLKRIQLLLCVDDDGEFGSKTRDGIRSFQETLGEGVGKADGKVGRRALPRLLAKVSELGDCPSGYMSYFERTRFDRPESIRKLQQTLNSVVESGLAIELSGKFDDGTRAKIVAARKALRIDENIGQEQVTKSLMLKLLPAPPSLN